MSSTTTTTTTTTTSTQDVKQLVVGTTTSNFDMGTFVTGTSLNPYIAARIVSFKAVNMRPNATLHVFFDSINVDQYCAPGVLGSGDTSDYNRVNRTGNWGTPVKSDDQGVVYGQFNIPSSTFKTGDRVLQLADVTSIKTGNDAITTTATSTFTASNMTVTTESITLTTVNPQLSWNDTTNTVLSQNVVSDTVTLPDGEIVNLHLGAYDPIAQTFRVRTPNNESGILVTSIDVYFKQKSLIGDHGVVVFLAGTENGYPDTSSILPFSTVYKTGSEINTSDDATVATTFTFEAPVFLSADQLFSFIVKPDANDPDFLVWFASLGDLDVTTGGQVYSQPTEGTAFVGASLTGWTALQTEYVKYTLKRADFTAQYGDVYFTNNDREYMSVGAPSYANSTSTWLPGDKVFASTNSTFSTAVASVYGYVQGYDSLTNTLTIDGSTGNWQGATYLQIHRFANTTSETPAANTLVASTNVVNIVNPAVNAVVPRFAAITAAGTSLKYDYKGTSNTFVVDTNAVKVNPDIETELRDYERIQMSKTNENVVLGGQKSTTLHAQLTSDSSLLSPVIDTVRSNVLSVHNLVDGLSFNLYDEMYNYGTALTKYISPIVTLNEGMDAEDLQIRLTAYRPYSSHICVYVKFLNDEDGEAITDKTWTPMNLVDTGVYSDFANPDDFRELNFYVPSAYRRFRVSGTASVSAVSPLVTGVGTKFTTELAVGRWVAVSGQKSHKVLSISSDTSMTVDSNFQATVSAPMYLVPPKTTAYNAANTVTQTTGTVTTSNTSNILTGTGTAWSTEFKKGDKIGVGGDMQRIVSVANNTSLAVETPWTSTQSSANVFNISTAGLTYLSNAGTVYSGFKRFQIKVVLLADDSSKVPVIDDLQAVCLQM